MAWKIDASHSTIEFSVKHMMIATVRGRFTTFDGALVLDEQNPERSVVEGSVQAASIDTNDPKRDAHLRSPDFFDVEKFPLMSYRAKSIRRVQGNDFKVAGDMTIKNATREVTFDVTYEGDNKDPWGGRRRAFTAHTSLARKDFDLTWNVALETGGWLVGDQVKINVDLELMYQPDAVPETSGAVAAAA